VAAEAEAGEARSPTLVRERKGGEEAMEAVGVENIPKAKKTKKLGTAKKTTKEGVKEKRAKDTRKKASEEAMLEQKAKEEALKNEALDFYRQLRERGLTPFDGASIDFHRKRNPVVFIPKETPLITAVKKRGATELLGGKRHPQSAYRRAVSEPSATASIIAGTRYRGLCFKETVGAERVQGNAGKEV
jgi:hypothetical protein